MSEVFVDEWLDAKATRKASQLPSHEDLWHIQTGSIVKIGTKREIFWVLVRDVSKEDIHGVVDNFLVATEQPYSIGSVVKFKRSHVLCVFPLHVDDCLGAMMELLDRGKGEK